MYPRLFGMLAVVLFPATLCAVDDPVKAAVVKGIKYLQAVHRPAPNYAGGSHDMGTATLAGLALLESGVPVTDAAIGNITQYIRKNALRQTGTYEVSLTIMYLDRLGHPADRPIIQFLGFRLLGGQAGNGGWSYDCGYALNADDEAKLTALLNKEVRLIAVPKKDLTKPMPKGEPRPDIPFDDTFPPTGKANTPPRTEPAKAVEENPLLHPEIVKWAKLVNIIDGQNEPKRAKDNGGDGDNSNTQFATLGLWCARKHGVPVQKAFTELDTRYRTSQSEDGGWGYNYQYRGNGGSTAAMTCAGLVAIAVNHGAQVAVLRNNNALKLDVPQPAQKGMADPENDDAIKRALKCLGSYITAAKGLPPEGRMDVNRKGKRFKTDDLNSNLYFLWSLERVAMIYGLDTIGNHDWYAWGADGLIESQRADGSWPGRNYHGASEELNTSFALLFLSRANVARDLSASLLGKVQDPGVAVLRGGGNELLKRPPEVVPATKNPLPDPVASVTPMPTNELPKAGPNTVPLVDGFSAEAIALSNKILSATTAEQPGLLRQLRDAKGIVNTEALARTAGKANGALQAEARDALARRLTRMTAVTLLALVKDSDREIRHAALLAVGYKNDKTFVPQLLVGLEEVDGAIVQAARTSLRLLSGKDYGPEFAAKAADKAKAIEDWKSWWKTQSN